jgi:hypothetical protein
MLAAEILLFVLALSSATMATNLMEMLAPTFVKMRVVEMGFFEKVSNLAMMETPTMATVARQFARSKSTVVHTISARKALRW